MNKGIGLPVFSGVAIGPAVVYRKAERVLPVSSGDPAVEKAKFEAALVTAREQLSALYEKAKVEIGEEQAAIVEVDTATGEERWSWKMKDYAWSSPVAVYDESGKAYVVVCDSAGNATLLDGASGTVLHQKNLGGLVEASPAVFEDTLVIGTRARQICGIKVN